MLVKKRFRAKIGYALYLMKEIFEIDNRNYDFLHDLLIKRHDIRLVYYGYFYWAKNMGHLN